MARQEYESILRIYTETTSRFYDRKKNKNSS